MDENEITKYQKRWDTAKVVLSIQHPCYFEGSRTVSEKQLTDEPQKQ